MIEQKSINWFPGHMKKTIDAFNEQLKLIDLIVEVVDSRAINLTSDSEILKQAKSQNKRSIKIALKSDLADLNKKEDDILYGNIYDQNFRKEILKKISSALKDKIDNLIKKGYANPKVYVAVTGLPNVGKSSFINFLLNKKNLISKNEPGVTRKNNWVKLDNNIYLLDTPGVSFKKIEDNDQANILVLLRTINWSIANKYDVIKFAYEYYLTHYENEFNNYYQLEEKLSFDDFLIYYANKNGILLKEGQANIDICLEKLYSDFSNNQTIKKVNYEK